MTMKTALIWILLLLGCQGFAQQTATDSFKPSMKYGKPSEEELAMTTYAPDTSATAVVLYSKCEVRYDLLANNFRILYNYEVKIKVLKSEGASYADIRIPYYSNESNAVITLKESISQLDASAYNMEGGEMVRTKMKRDLVFTERINKQCMQLKFSIPAVREGTVFEYKYQLSSDLYYSINLWEAQRDIPVIFTQYDITIPEYFKFNLDMRGPHPMASKDETSSLTFLLSLPGGQTEMLSCNGRHMIFTGEHLPALRPDNYVWCANDYMSSVYFELRGVDFPGSFYRSFTHTWEEIDQMLLQDEDFGAMLKMRNPYRDEMASLSLDQLPDRQNRIAAIYTFLKQKISWNGQYGLYGNEVKKAVKNGTGSNADINFILMSMLRDAQIPCYPAVMSRKDRGILPYSYPSIQKLNTFIVGIADTDSTLVFLDGSVINGYMNTLPPVLMVNRARLISETAGGRWMNLSKLGKNQIRATVRAQIHPDGQITGDRNAVYMGQYAANLRRRYYAAKDSTEYINQLETEENIKVKKFETRELNVFSPRITEFLDFEKQATVNDDLIYVNPMIFLHVSKCPFIQTERQLPLEMPYTEHILQATMLTIPEGYAVEELPKPLNLKTEDGQDIVRYNISQSGNTINVTYTFIANKLLHLATEYPTVKMFWENVAEKNNELIVLKKQ